jgi:hypothetical protein
MNNHQICRISPRTVTVFRNRILRAIYRRAGLLEPKRIKWTPVDMRAACDPLKLGEVYQK